MDWSQPISTLLRDGTAKAHEAAEHSQGAAWLTRGELDREEYARFLMMLWEVYNAIETNLDKYSTHPVLAPTYQPSLLARATRLARDIEFLLDIPTEDTWKSHPIYTELKSSPPESLTAYVDRINELAEEGKGTEGLLLAHGYVRYLGDLSGGQIIKRRIAKSYGLPNDGSGVRFYVFDTGNGFGGEAEAAAGANAGEMKKIKDWYRAGMDVGVGEDEALKASLVDEAVNVFHLNQALFTTLRGPSVETHLSEPIVTSFGDLTPSSPITLVHPSDVKRAHTNGHANGHADDFVPSPSKKVSAQTKGNAGVSTALVVILILSIINLGVVFTKFGFAPGWVVEDLERGWGWIVGTIAADLK